MPLFAGVGARIRDRLIALGYQQPNGKPDVRRFCREKAYDDTLFYFWLRDANTPMKDRARLATDLGISEVELLHGIEPKKATPPMRRPHKARGLLLALGLGGGLLWPSSSVAGQTYHPQSTLVDYVKRRLFRNSSGYLGLGTAYAV